MSDENRPKAAYESPTKAIAHSLAESALTNEDRQAAYLAGYDDGMHHRFGLEVAEAAQAALHAEALVSLRMASRSAVHGPAFSAMVTEAGERE